MTQQQRQEQPLMNADERRFIHPDEKAYPHSELTDRIISVFYDVYNELGHGFVESVYEQAMFRALRGAGLDAERQVPVPVWFRGEQIAEFRADLVVSQCVIVELKAARIVEPSFEAQLLNYLRATPIEVGLLLNFGPRPTVRRFAFGNDRKKISVHQR